MVSGYFLIIAEVSLFLFILVSCLYIYLLWIAIKLLVLVVKNRVPSCARQLLLRASDFFMEVYFCNLLVKGTN